MRLYLSVIVVVLILIGIFKPVNLFSDTSLYVLSSGVLQDNEYRFSTMKNDSGGWYFKIFRGDKAFINQNQIPAISGTKAFSDSIQAAKVAQLMTLKLSKGVFPPGISIDELDSLKINY